MLYKDGVGKPLFFCYNYIGDFMEYSPKKMKEKIDEKNFKFKKKFGQNFIVDANIIENIVSKSEILPNSLVIEVGPGAGSLTACIAKYAKQVLCFEIDTEVKEILEENTKEFNNIDIIFEDFLKVNLKEVLKKYEYDNLYLIANLPYYITTPIIIKTIEENIKFDKLVVMVQKEVGDRFKAKPKTKDYGSLSVFLNYYYDIFKLMDVSKNVFMPRPNVDSIVVEFRKKDNHYKVKNEEIFFKLVRDSFKQKRKNLKNNLNNYDLNIIEKVLKENNFSLASRAEELDIEIFIKIANDLGD